MTLASPCYNRSSVDNATTSLFELPLSGKLNLRGQPSDTAFMHGTQAALTLSLPTEPNTLTQQADLTAYWLGPNEWQLNSGLEKTADLQHQLHHHLDNIHHACVEVSDYYTSLSLQGRTAANLLAKGCPLDLHPHTFPTDAIAQTRFGHATILLHRRSPTRFDLQVRWSYTEYVWDYLLSAMEVDAQ